VARILLLGSTGFFGRGVAHRLIDDGHQLRVLVRDPMKAAAFKVRGAQVIVGNVLDPAVVMQSAQGVDHMISLVAAKRNRHQDYLAVNIDAPRILGETAKAVGAQSVVYVSEVGAKLDPNFKYLTSRWMGEQELAKTGVPGTILRFSHVLAEQGGIVDLFEKLVAGPFAIIPGSGQAQLQPILREDAARCVVETITRPDMMGRIVELGGPEVVTYEHMFDWFLQARGITKAKVRLPLALLLPGTTVMDVFMNNAPLTPDEANTLQLPKIASGIDSVSVNYGWRATQPSGWAPGHWNKAIR
jgi:uncharacterized protein YbjT (DUF2867 family)